MGRDDRDEESWTEWKRLVLDSIKRHEESIIGIGKRMDEERKDREAESRKFKWIIIGGIVSLAGQFLFLLLKT